jgi:hypothetical protein
MADEILSIDTDTLDGIANAIRNKGGLPQSNKLSFPDGMVNALRNIETVATVTPKISPPSTVELTPSNTSYPIESGYHTNNTRVFINATTGSATPSSTEQTYYPPSPYSFFSSFWVDGIGEATQIVTGTVILNNARDLIVSGLSFTPIGIIVLHRPDPNVKRYDNQVLNAISVPNLNPNTTGTGQNSGSYVVTTISFSFSGGSATVSSTSYARFYDTYFYIVFGR